MIRVTRHDNHESLTVDKIEDIQPAIRKANWPPVYYTLTHEPENTWQADTELALYLRSSAPTWPGALKTRALDLASRLERHSIP
jgi:hypothetical protein